jgi:cyclophilin family peptidyl-prolyl cis-trans isomerase/HEAT repeat protein
VRRHLSAALLVVALTVPLAASQGRGPVGRTMPSMPTFTCGTDTLVPFPIPVSWFTIALAADSRLYVPCLADVHTDAHREVRDARVLDDAVRSTVPEIRRLAVAAYGRVGRPEFVGVLAHALEDPAASVRREAANALGNALSGVQVEPDDGEAPPSAADRVTFARASLDARLIVEKDDDVAGMILETLGRLKYADDQTRDDVEVTLVTYAIGAPARILGVAKGLEALVRASPRRPIQAGTREKLRELAVVGRPGTPVPTIAGAGSAEGPSDEATFARVRRLAMQSLQTVRDDDLVTVRQAARDADWQVRRFGALRLDLSRPDHAPLYQQLAADRAFQVRYEVVTAEARLAARTHECGALLARVDDPAPTVALHAIDVLPPGCADPGPVVNRLKMLAEQIVSAGSGPVWHAPTHAALTLARLSPATVDPFVAAMSRHSEWQVRVAAATIAGLRGGNALALQLSTAGPANVRTAALEALAQMKSADLTKAATRALMDGTDHQLLRTAASVLKGTPEPLRDDVNLALLAALDKLTRLGADNSRDARVAILQRLQELLPPEWSSRFNPYASDFDPRVRAAAVTAYEKLLDTTNAPPAKPLHRYPLQPAPDQFQNLPTRARIRMGGGVIEMELLTQDAPVTVARFVELVKAGYYNGLTFHRVVPNFVIQGGSPGANEYVGAPRFWRDEVGTVPHTRGAVGISTRGHDTGDGQIFIDLVDLPRLDHDYTVFARITTGLDVVDRILEGARIESITTIVR